MLAQLQKEKQNIVVVGDVFVAPDTMAAALERSSIAIGKISEVFWGEPDVTSFSVRQVNIEKNGPDAEAYPTELDSLIEDADVLMTHFAPIPRNLIEKAKRLKVILTCRGGLEHICVDAATQHNIPVVNVIRNAEPVADFTLGLIIALTRNIASSHRLLMEGKWTKDFPNYQYTTTLSQLKVGIAGLGNVGIVLAKYLRALGVSVLGHDDYITKESLVQNGLGDVEMMDLKTLFQEADVISMHLRLTEETRGMIDQSFFQLMKPGGYFINTSRGGLVNQRDLIDALRAHSIAGAALDVFEAEPITREMGFSALDNILLTPHIAGDTVSAVPESPFLLMREFEAVLANGNIGRIVNARGLKDFNF